MFRPLCPDLPTSASSIASFLVSRYSYFMSSIVVFLLSRYFISNEFYCFFPSVQILHFKSSVVSFPLSRYQILHKTHKPSYLFCSPSPDIPSSTSSSVVVFTSAPSCLSSSLLSSSFIIIYLLAPDEDNFLSKALVFPCVSSDR